MDDEAATGIRLIRFLARAGIASRRHAERIVREGRITVNGGVVDEPGTRVDPDKDSVKLDGKRVRMLTSYVYVLLNKPAGVVSTMEDPRGRPCVGDLLGRVRGRPIPAGRLDFDTEGLLLCTNDGEMVHRITHPRHRMSKVYQVKVKGVPVERQMERLRNGIVLDGKRTLPARVSFQKRGARNTWLRVTLQEGRNRQIKRMCEAVGLRVLKLKRVALGPLRLEGLPPGKYRLLNAAEVRKLRELSGGVDKGSEGA